MKKYLINIIKEHKSIYILYYFVFNTALKMLSCFIKADSKTILFVCNGGRKFSDNIRPIFEGMVNDSRFDKWSFIWAFRNPSDFDLSIFDRTNKVKIDSLSYYISALKSKCWITNVTVQRGLSFKREENFYVNTWHGFPIKFVGKDIKDGPTFQMKNVEKFDLLLTEGSIDAITMNKAFDAENTVVTGYPRNDKMFSGYEETKKKVRKELGIDEKKIVVLYAPTYRDFDKDEFGNFSYENGLSVEKFRKALGDQYILLIRAHPAIASKLKFSDKCINVSSYPCVEDLLVCSDILISDYSGIIADFALLGKPIFCYMFDFEKYAKLRGLYTEVLDNLIFSNYSNDDELYEAIKTMNYEEECERSREFVHRCGLLGEGSTKRAVDAIANGLSL